METQPPVSCFCLTYGRPRLLIPVGRVVLQPHWKHDDPKLIADHLSTR